MECIIPWIAHKIKDKKEEKETKKDDDMTKTVTDRTLTHQAALDDYEQFGKCKLVAVLSGAYVKHQC